MSINSDLQRLIVASLVILGTFGLFVLLMFLDLPQGSKEALIIAFTIVVAKFQTVIDYFFGSSDGSKEKTKLLGDMK